MSGGIFKGPTALGIGCAGCGQAEEEPQAWWQQEVKTTPWWHETPHLMQPVQTKPWYMAPEAGPTPDYVPTAPTVEGSKYLIPALVIGGLAIGAALLFSGKKES